MNNIPIIKLEVERMQHSIQVALLDYHAQLSSEVQEAIERYCTKDNLQAIIDKEVRESIDMCVKAEVRDFFGYGREGRSVVREAIKAHLALQYPDELWKGEPG